MPTEFFTQIGEATRNSAVWLWHTPVRVAQTMEHTPVSLYRIIWPIFSAAKACVVWLVIAIWNASDWLANVAYYVLACVLPLVFAALLFGILMCPCVVYCESRASRRRIDIYRGHIYERQHQEYRDAATRALDLEIYKKWKDQCDEVIRARAGELPEPPVWPCSQVVCTREQRRISACRHSRKAALRILWGSSGDLSGGAKAMVPEPPDFEYAQANPATRGRHRHGIGASYRKHAE
ncbi:hypothetical protein ANO11243_059470 [Dothideomycetidae sp. 11243]|nr:hypothetical protein ANO11243_059470 [fungal sp. No.11243]